jgi:hypothetical protein
MRIALVTLLCTLVLTAAGRTGARTDDRADVEKELKKYDPKTCFFIQEQLKSLSPAR